MVGHDDVGAHPGMEHVAIYDDAARLRKVVGLFGPVRQTQIEDGREAVPAGVDVVQNGVAVAQAQRLAAREYLHTRHEGAGHVVELRGRRFARFAGVDAVEPHHDVAQPAARPDEQPFVRDALPTDIAVLPNRQPCRGSRRSVVEDAAGDTAAVLDPDFLIGVRQRRQEQRQPDDEARTQTDGFPKGTTYRMISRPFRPFDRLKTLQSQRAGP